MKHTKRLLLIILCMLMVVTTMPLSNAFAVTDTEMVERLEAVFGPFFDIDDFTDEELEALYIYFFEPAEHGIDCDLCYVGDDVVGYCNTLSESQIVKYMQSAWNLAFVQQFEESNSLTDVEVARLNYLIDEIAAVEKTQVQLKEKIDENRGDTTVYQQRYKENEQDLVNYKKERDELVAKAGYSTPADFTEQVKEQQKKVDAAMAKVKAAQEIRREQIEAEEAKKKQELIESHAKYKNPEPASYEKFSASGKNMYAVIIRNGNTVPDLNDISFFEVTYKDNTGTIRRDFFNPKEAYELAQDVATKAATKAAVSDYSAKAAKETASVFHMGDETGSVAKVFTPQATEMFMFETHNPISGTDPFISFSYMTAKDCKKFEWTVNRLDIVSLDKVYGWENVGYFCDQPYVNYSGTRYASLGANRTIGESGVKQAGTTTDMNSVPGNTRYIIAGNQYDYYATGSAKQGVYQGKNIGRMINETGTVNTYENTKTYLMNITLADINNGGIEAYNTDYYENVLSLCETLNAEINYTDMDGVNRTVYYPVMANSIAYYLENLYSPANIEVDYTNPYDLNSAISFAQQGENIPFKIDIPECLDLNYINFYYRDNITDKTEYFKNLNKLEGSAKRADQFITDNNDGLAIAGVQFWDFADVMKSADEIKAGAGSGPKAYLDTKADNPNINPEIKGHCTYFYKHGSTAGMRISTKQSFSFTNPITGIDSSSDYNNYIKRQSGTTGAVTYDLSGSLTKYTTAEAEAAGRGNIEMIVPQTGLEGEGWYAMEISTDDMSLASTTAEAYVAIKYQPTGAADGELKTTAGISISEAAADYYGFWAGAEARKLTQKAPDADYKSINAAYRYGVGAGNIMTVIFRLPDVSLSQIKGVVFSLDASIDDDWQIKDFRIYPISGVTKREVTAVDMKNFNKVFSNRYYTRNTIKRTEPGGISKVLKSGEDLQLLLQRGATYEYTFGENGQEEIEVNKNRADYIFDYWDSMPLEVASQEMGFMDTIKTYTVNVEVGMNEDYGTVYDSCGSSNYFYFQLEFENGNSSYVLANQQLSADGFRSGQIESFTISTNMDYGALQAIKIIPDSTYEYADPTDKLCITSITVTRGSNSGIRKQWKIDYVGWISVQFSDTGGDDESQKARTANELVQTFQVTSEALAVALEFEITTGDSGKTAKGEDYGQFIGNLTADIQYQTMSGGTKTLADVQVVKAMYDYYNHGALIDDDSMCYMSDEDMMFRQYKTDRFEVEISDFKSLTNIKFYASSDSPKCLNITGVNVSVIASKGRLAINKNDEYQRKYNKDPIYLTCANAFSYQFVTTGSDSSMQWVRIGQIVNFNDNEIENVVDTEETMNIISEVPQSNNDKLNFFFELDYDNGATRPVTGENPYVLTLMYKYSAQCGSNSNELANYVTMVANNDQSGFYAVGQDASRFKELTFLELSMEGRNGAVCAVKDGKLTVQRTRSGVVIETREVILRAKKITPNITTSFQSFNAISNTGEKQIITLQLTSNTKAYALTPKDKDVAIAFRYKSSKDISGGSNLYTSKYVYATASGITQIRGGSVLTFEFNEPYVGDISDIIVMPTGGLHVMTSAAYALDETVKDGNVTINNYYSFAHGCDAALGGGRMYRETGDAQKDEKGDYIAETEVTDWTAWENTNTVREVNVEIETGTLSSGTAAPLRADMEIFYEQSGEQRGSVVSRKYVDVQNYLTNMSETSFVSGTTQTLKFLIPNFGTIRSIKLIPRDETGTGSWVVNKITSNSYACTQSGLVEADRQTISVDKIAYEAEGGYQYSMAYLNIGGTVKYSDSQMNGYEVSLPNSEFPKGSEYVATVLPGKKIVLETIVSGSVLAGNKVDYKVFDKTGDGTSVVDTTYYKVNADNRSIEFTAPENNTAANMKYTITASCIECPSEKLTVSVVVLPNPDAKQENTVSDEVINAAAELLLNELNGNLNG